MAFTDEDNTVREDRFHPGRECGMSGMWTADNPSADPVRIGIRWPEATLHCQVGNRSPFVPSRALSCEAGRPRGICEIPVFTKVNGAATFANAGCSCSGYYHHVESLCIIPREPAL